MNGELIDGYAASMTQPLGATRAQFAEWLRALVGSRIRTVHYFLIEQEGYDRPWNHDAFHTLDIGCDLGLESGRTLGVTWGWEFVPYGLSFVDGSVRSMTQGSIQCIDVSQNDRWEPLVGKQVVRADLAWASIDRGTGSGDVRSYPQDLCIVLDDTSIVTVSAVDYIEVDHRFYLTADNVTIFFDTAVARAAGVGQLNTTSIQSFVG